VKIMTQKGKVIFKKTFVESAASVAGAAARWAGGGFCAAAAEVFAEREKLCRECGFWNTSAFFGTGGCKICGCSKLKLKMPKEKCPIGKW